MEVILTVPAIGMLNILLNDPQRLLPGSPIKPYPVPDQAAAMEVIAIIKWLQSKLLVITPEGKLDPASLKPWRGHLNPVIHNRLKAIVKHYEPVGLLTHNVVAYMSLVRGLEGRSLGPEIIDIEEPGAGVDVSGLPGGSGEHTGSNPPATV